MGRSRTNTLVLAGVALTVLLGVVAFVARGHSEPSGGGPANRDASQVLANTMFTVWFLAMAVGAVFLVYALGQGRRYRQQTSRRSPPFVQLALLFVILAIVVATGAHFHFFARGHGSQRSAPASN